MYGTYITYPCKSYVSKIHPQARGIVVQEDLNESEEEEELSKLVFFTILWKNRAKGRGVGDK